MIYEKLLQNKTNEFLQYHYCERDSLVEAGTVCGPLIRDHYIIECCVGGTGSVIVNGTEFTENAGDMLILFPNDIVTHLTGEKPKSSIWCALTGIQVTAVLKAAGISSLCPYVNRESAQSILRELEELYKMKNDLDSGADFRRIGCIYKIFGELTRSIRKTSNRDYVDKAISFIESKYDKINDVNEIADNVGLERCYFSTLFKKETGMTPHVYLTKLRIEKACRLIEYSGQSIYVIAQAVGINPVNFSRLFRKYIGMTPTEYSNK